MNSDEEIQLDFSDVKVLTPSWADEFISGYENRLAGISLANEICRKYRREGKYFDLPYDRTQWLGEENLLYDIMEERQNLKQGDLYDTEALFWIGYTYRYWHFLFLLELFASRYYIFV